MRCLNALEEKRDWEALRILRTTLSSAHWVCNRVVLRKLHYFLFLIMTLAVDAETGAGKVSLSREEVQSQVDSKEVSLWLGAELFFR